MDRIAILRTLAIVAGAALLVAALIALYPWATGCSSKPAATSASRPDNFSAELLRCSALGPNDPVDPACRALWEENRRRFFGKAVSHE